MKQTIIMSGGLGNQMFQYALYCSMREKGIRVKIDISLYEFNRMHNGYMLDYAFGLNISHNKINKYSVLWTRLIRSNRAPFLLFREDESRFCDDVFTTYKPYIDGCWIDERYFFNIKKKIISQFSFRNIDQKNLMVANMMKVCNSVSLHIRRGDYLSQSMYNICNESYYKSAIEYIISRVEDSKLFIFSDDPEWCKYFMEKFNVDYEIIQHNFGKDSYKDMYLMTQCKHNIIANSTFSWWGAWLNNNAGKNVVCPSVWINGRDFNPCLEEWYHI